MADTIEQAARVIDALEPYAMEVRDVQRGWLAKEIAQALHEAGMLVSGEPVAALALSADFAPEGGRDGFVEWTFAVPKHHAFGAGVWDISFRRKLSADEISDPYSALPTPPEGK